jgi:hypothetical protein
MVNSPRSRLDTSALAIRWIARGWSILSFVLVGAILVGEVLQPSAPLPSTARDLIGLILFPFGTCLGMLLAWRWEAVGGSTAMACLAAFYAFMYILDGRFPRGPFFGLLAAPGALFLASYALSHWHTKSRRK